MFQHDDVAMNVRKQRDLRLYSHVIPSTATALFSTGKTDAKIYVDEAKSVDASRRAPIWVVPGEDITATKTTEPAWNEGTSIWHGPDQSKDESCGDLSSCCIGILIALGLIATCLITALGYTFLCRKGKDDDSSTGKSVLYGALSKMSDAFRDCSRCCACSFLPQGCRLTACLPKKCSGKTGVSYYFTMGRLYCCYAKWRLIGKTAEIPRNMDQKKEAAEEMFYRAGEIMRKVQKTIAKPITKRLDKSKNNKQSKKENIYSVD